MLDIYQWKNFLYNSTILFLIFWKETNYEFDTTNTRTKAEIR